MFMHYNESKRLAAVAEILYIFILHLKVIPTSNIININAWQMKLNDVTLVERPKSLYRFHDQPEDRTLETVFLTSVDTTCSRPNTTTNLTNKHKYITCTCIVSNFVLYVQI